MPQYASTSRLYRPQGRVRRAELIAAWVMAHWRALAIGAGAMVLGVMVGIWRAERTEADERRAATLLYQAGQVPEGGASVYEDLIRQYPETVAGRVAALRAGAAASAKGEWERAAQFLAPVTEAKRVHPLLRVAALEGLAVAYEVGKDYPRAAEIYQRLLREPGAVDPAPAVRGAVRCLVAAGRVPEARTLLETVEAKGADAAEWRDLKETELLWLDLLAAQSGSR